jgi:hypothetical protein
MKPSNNTRSGLWRWKSFVARLQICAMRAEDVGDFELRLFNERFEREARAVAALNHPKVCTLHDIGPNYLVMELVENPTLFGRIREGAIPPEEALSIARQIADAFVIGGIMNLFRKLQKRAESGDPIRVGLIGAGKFGSMFLSSAARAWHSRFGRYGFVGHARPPIAWRVSWNPERHNAITFAEAIKEGTTFVQDDAEVLISHQELDVVIDATGIPAAGIRHALLACKHRKHIVMVNVEADVLAGPLLARRAAEAGIVD